MKKKNVISLIKYYTEKNDAGFRNEAYEVAKEFDASGNRNTSWKIKKQCCKRFERRCNE